MNVEPAGPTHAAYGLAVATSPIGGGGGNWWQQLFVFFLFLSSFLRGVFDVVGLLNNFSTIRRLDEMLPVLEGSVARRRFGGLQRRRRR